MSDVGLTWGASQMANHSPINFTPASTGRWSALFTGYEQRAAALALYLHSRSEIGFSPYQFEIYRANYFCRTDLTIRGIARIASMAAGNGDWVSLRSLAQNLFEECGEHRDGGNHRTLLEASHNLHGSLVFGLQPLTISDSLESELILPETRFYRASRTKAFYESNYTSALAASFAQETAAGPMMQLFFDHLFRPYRTMYSDSLWPEAARYFTVHLDGVEENHGLMALDCLERQIAISGEVIDAESAIKEFLDCQASLWEALHVSLQGAESPTDSVKSHEELSPPKQLANMKA